MTAVIHLWEVDTANAWAEETAPVEAAEPMSWANAVDRAQNLLGEAVMDILTKETGVLEYVTSAGEAGIRVAEGYIQVPAWRIVEQPTLDGG